MRRFALLFALALACVGAAQLSYALCPHEVLVVYNSRDLPSPSSPNYEIACQIIPASETIARYYASARGVPPENLLGLPLAPFYESALETSVVHEYRDCIATPISNYLSQPEHAHIKCIVLCYGIPSRIVSSNGTSSLDSALTLLGNPDVLSVRHWGLTTTAGGTTSAMITNSYLGKNTDFATFRDSAANSFAGPEGRIWRLNYLVCRLDGFSEPTENVTVNGNTVAIPRDIKALVDRSVNSTAGGKFVVDRPDADAERNRMVSEGMNSDDIVTDQTSVFLTGLPGTDIIGYFGEHVAVGEANSYTTWGRPFFQSWRNGAIALANTNDGQSFRVPKYFWGPLTVHGTPEAHTLTVTDMHHSNPGITPQDRYSTHRVALCKRVGDQTYDLATSHFDGGTCAIDLSSVVWPDDHKTFIELRFPDADPQHPGRYIPDSRTPITADETIWNARETGITFSCGYDNPSNRKARVVSPAYLCDGPTGATGASGTISFVDEPGGVMHEPRYVFSRYSSGFSWAESAYMGLDNLAWQAVVIGDPLMAPYGPHPLVAITSPGWDGQLKKTSFTVEAVAVDGSEAAVHGVHFFIVAQGGAPVSLGFVPSAPYAITLDPANYAPGIYIVRAVPHDEADNPYTDVAERKVALIAGSVTQSGIYNVRQAADGSGVELNDLVVTAAGSSSFEGAMYVTDSVRVAGMRVNLAQGSFAIPAPGRRLALCGTVSTSPEGEREIVPIYINYGGSVPAPKPVGFVIRSLGGSSPNEYTNGIDDVVGLYNVGQLVRICGRVNYVGGDFVYMDDGSGGTDGSGTTYFPVPIDGSDIPVNGVEARGVRVYLGNLGKPKIGDYIAVNGISSIKLLNGHYARYLRATSAPDVVCGYQTCYVWSGPGYWRFFANGDDSRRFQIGDRIRISTEDVIANFGNYFTAWCRSPSRGMWSSVCFGATTALTVDYTGLIVVGTITGTNSDVETEFSIRPDAIYRGAVGSNGIGLLSFSNRALQSGSYKPSHGQSTEDVLASDRFRDMDTRPNCIGWALCQPDGTVVELKSEIICTHSPDGRLLGLQEPYEPSPIAPRLVLCLPKAVSDITLWKQIDIVGGTLATLSNGQRAILYPQAVYVQTDMNARPIFLMPKWFGRDGEPEDWPWRRLVYSR